MVFFFFFSSRRRHTRWNCDWSSDVCSSDLGPLGLPAVGQVEQVPDAKAMLQDALAKASGASGRRLRRFKRDFGGQRRRLLEALDHAGPIAQLTAWKELVQDVEHTIGAL